jgi:hypothetical protein
MQGYTYQKYYPKINIFLLMKRIKIKTIKKMEKTHGHSEYECFYSLFPSLFRVLLMKSFKL